MQNPGITQQDITDQLSIDKSCTSRACKFLEANGFIYKEKSSVCSHGFLCFATEKGQDVCRRVIELEDIHIHALFQNLDVARLNNANDFLFELIEKLKTQT